MKKLALTIAAGFAAIGLAAVPAVVNAAGDPCDYYQGPDKELVCPSSEKNEQTAQSTIKTILETVYLYVGIIAVIVIIVGGVFYMISQGDAQKIKHAKDAILYAAIGLMVTLLAFAITEFALQALGSSEPNTSGGDSSKSSSKVETKEGEDSEH